MDKSQEHGHDQGGNPWYSPSRALPHDSQLVRWRPIETCPKEVGEIYLVSDGKIFGHARWEQVPNLEWPPRWNTFEGSPFDDEQEDWRGESGYGPGVIEWEPLFWSEPLLTPPRQERAAKVQT